MSEPQYHGQGGLWCGGEWVDLEDCDKVWNQCNGCEASDATGTGPVECGDDEYDVIIVGAGCVGACVARELSRYHTKVLWLEKADDVTQGPTKANSGIVHAGYDDKPGSVKSRFCWPGNQMFPQMDKELHFGYLRNGSLVVARGPGDEPMLQELLERGHQNGVKRLRIIGKEELRKMEPHISDDATAALYSPDAGTVTPYEFTIAVAENAVDNGVKLSINTEVVGIDAGDDSFAVHTVEANRKQPQLAARLAGSSVVLAAAFCAANFGAGVPTAAAAAFGAFAAAGALLAATQLLSSKKRTYRSRYVVNAAGLFSDKVANMIGDTSFKIKPRLGEYLLFHKDQGDLARHVLFPCPSKMGKGVLVQPTLWGNLLLGPTARDIHDPETAKATPTEIITKILTACRRLVPAFDAGHIIHSFAGCRAKTDVGDWQIRPSDKAPRFIHAAGVDSPGLAGSPAIAVEVVKLLAAAGLELKDDASFNPVRRPLVVAKNGWKGLTLKHKDPAKHVVCKCEKVTEAEIVDAIHRRLPVDSTQAVRKRTRAGMGHCQGEYCESRVAKIIARETKLAEKNVGRRPWPASSLLPQRWLTDAQKSKLQHLA
eukprot:m.237990 g.237990  ORF g.237990 m.237990 type:complete len:598 (-) comp18962_c0_seq7:124-1917(-)